MNTSPAFTKLFDIGVEFVKRHGFTDAYLRSLVFYGGLRSHPDDVVDFNIVAKQDFFSAFKSITPAKPGWLSQRNTKMTVLTVVVSISRIVESGFVIAHKQGDTIVYFIF